MQITMLGTSSMVPTKERNAQAIYIDYNGEGILVDCGEGTQRQMNMAGINRNKIKKILITHWHGDHVGGLIGLLQTISNSENNSKINIYGPKDTKKRLAHMLESVDFEHHRLDVEAHDISPKDVEKIYENENYKIECARMDHSMLCLGYSIILKDKRKILLAKAKKLGLKEGPLLGKLQKGHEISYNGKTVVPDDVSHVEKGKKLTIILDTLHCENAVKLAYEADILVIETTYTSELEEKGIEYKHLTTKEAALIATQAQVKRVVITHFSQRYKSVKPLEEEMKILFQNSEAAYDFMKIKM